MQSSRARQNGKENEPSARYGLGDYLSIRLTFKDSIFIILLFWGGFLQITLSLSIFLKVLIGNITKLKNIVIFGYLTKSKIELFDWLVVRFLSGALTTSESIGAKVK